MILGAPMATINAEIGPAVEVVVPPVGKKVTLQVGLRGDLIAPDEVAVDTPKVELPVVIKVPVITPVVRDTPDKACRKPYTVKCFVGVPLYEDITVPRTGGLVYEGGSEFPPYGPVTPPEVDNVVCESVSEVYYGPEAVSLPAKVLSSVPTADYKTSSLLVVYSSLVSKGTSLSSTICNVSE